MIKFIDRTKMMRFIGPRNWSGMLLFLIFLLTLIILAYVSLVVRRTITIRDHHLLSIRTDLQFMYSDGR